MICFSSAESRSPYNPRQPPALGQTKLHSMDPLQLSNYPTQPCNLLRCSTLSCHKSLALLQDHHTRVGTLHLNLLFLTRVKTWPLRSSL